MAACLLLLFVPLFLVPLFLLPAPACYYSPPPRYHVIAVVDPARPAPGPHAQPVKTP